MVHANAVILGDRTRLLAMDPIEHPVALQLGGSEPALLAQAARIGAEHGFDEINLNCGCPSDRVQAGRFGACLMREPALVADSVAAMVAACDVPVTVKCRLGVDDDHDYDRFLAFIDTVAAAGCRMFVVHARNAWLKGLSPKENREVPPLRYDWAYRLKRERPDSAGHRQRRHRDGDRSDGAPGACRRRDARPRGVPRSLPAASARCRAGSAATLRTRGELLRAMRPYVEDQLARGVCAQAHHPPPARPVRGRARRPRVPPGAERRRAQARRGLVAGRARARARPQSRRPLVGMITRDIGAFLARARSACARLRPADRARRVPGRARRFPPRRRNRRATTATWPTPRAFDAARASDATSRAASRARAGRCRRLLRRRSRHARCAVPQQRLRHRGRAATSSAACATRCASAKPTRADIRGFFGGVLDYAEIDLSDQAASLRTHRRAGDRPRARPRLLRAVGALRRDRRAADARGLRPARDACCSTWRRANTTPTSCWRSWPGAPR